QVSQGKFSFPARRQMDTRAIGTTEPPRSFAMSTPVIPNYQQSVERRKTCGRRAKLTNILGMGCSTPRLDPRGGFQGVEETGGYCWSTYFKVLEVLFLGEGSSAFLPSKKPC